MDLNDAARRLEALGNPTRLAVFRLLVQAGHDGLAFGQIQRVLGGASSTLSHHVAHLARVGLIRQERRGREIISTADYAATRELLNFLVTQCCQGVAGSGEAADDTASAA